MKHNIVHIIIFISLLSFSSCNLKENTDKLDVFESTVSLSISKDSDYQPHVINEALSGDYQKYLEYYEPTDYQIGISSSKDGGLPGGTSISCISGISHVRKGSLTKAELMELPSIRSFVDGNEISPMNISQTKASNDILDSFGKVVKFTFINSAQTKSSDETTGEAEVYVPQVIEFTFPHAETEKDLNPLCYYKDFVIRWNKDEKNKNGVLVAVHWTGSMVLGNDITGANVCRVANFPDTGEAQLPESFFDGVPDTAYCDLLIFRGNIENIKQGDYSYKLIGKTHHLISFILIREIVNQ